VPAVPIVEPLVCLRLDFDEDHELVAEALRLEAEVWEQRGFNDGGSIDDYAVFAAQSRVFAVFDSAGTCFGTSRVFTQGPEPLPFLEMPFFHELLRTVLLEQVSEGYVEELGTSAVSLHAPHFRVVRYLWRMAYRDAIARGVRRWGIIMEPPKVAAMNRKYGFCFRQLGEERYYQGGYCAAHALDLVEVDAHMARESPREHRWFTSPA
jgi:hypothetical protein